jgi:hypothetical protein
VLQYLASLLTDLAERGVGHLQVSSRRVRPIGRSVVAGGASDERRGA